MSHTFVLDGYTVTLEYVQTGWSHCWPMASVYVQDGYQKHLGNIWSRRYASDLSELEEDSDMIEAVRNAIMSDRCLSVSQIGAFRLVTSYKRRSSREEKGVECEVRYSIDDFYSASALWSDMFQDKLTAQKAGLDFIKKTMNETQSEIEKFEKTLGA